MKDLTDVDTYHAVITVPEDGIDPRTAASVEDAFQKLTDRTHNINERLTHDHGLIVENRHVHYPVGPWTGAEWNFTFSGGFAEQYMLQNPVNTGTAFFHIPLVGLPIAGWKFSQIRIYLVGASVHACDTPPSVALYRSFDNGPSVKVEQIGTTGVDDTTASDYDEWHTLLVGGLSGGVELLEDSLYHLRVSGEKDTGAVANLKCYGARVTLLVPDDYAY